MRARVTLTIEIDVSDVWGGDGKLDQVYRQAREAAVARLNRGLSIGALSSKIIGESTVTAILVEETR